MNQTHQAIPLDEMQRRFAESHTGEGASRHLTGLESSAGTGKTQALIGRFMHLIDEGRKAGKKDPAGRILMMTFTNLARDNAERRIVENLPELKERIPEDGVVQNPWDPEPLWIGTFHAIASRILKLHMPWMDGRMAPLRILDDSESRQVMHDLMKEYANEFPKAAYASNTWRELNRFQEILREGKPSKAASAYRQYLVENDAIDFDGLMIETARLFRDNPKVKRAWENAFDHVLVDEYQDTDPIQTEILEVLCRNASLAVAGDAAQSIYGWRNAVGNLSALNGLVKRQNRRWSKVHLKADYRLTREIQDCAEHMAAEIASLKSTPHEPPSPSARSGPIPLHTTHGPDDLYNLLEQRLRQHQEETGSIQGSAILCRTNREVAEAAGELGARGIPVRLAKRDDEVDAIAIAQAWWKLLLYPRSDTAFREIASREGIPAQVVAPHAQRATAEGAAIWEVIPTAAKGEDEDEKTQDLIQLAQRARKVYTYYNEREDHQPPDPSLRKFFELNGCAEHFLNQFGQQSFESKLCESYRRSCEGVASRKRDLFKTAQVMTASAGRLQTHETLKDEDFVEIRTIHSAKGLEYHTVLCPNWAEEKFPRSGKKPDLEAEMKLAYVAITRASHHFESFSPNRTEYGNSLAPSRFVQIMKMREQIQEDNQNAGPKATEQGG